jgi:hypothetical protein
MVNEIDLAIKARSLISFEISSSCQRVKIRRCCCPCGRRPTGAGGVIVDGPPNRRSKNEGPEEKLLSLAKLTPAGNVPFGRE